MATMNISLPDQMKDWIEAQVATGRYANVSDFVRDLVRERQEQREAALERLNAEIQRGIDSGPGGELDWDRIRATALDRAEELKAARKK